MLDRACHEKIATLFIVGDLFDYWFEYRSVIPRGFTRTLGGLARLVDSGVRVEYVIGNHDFGHRDYFESEIGVRVHTEDVEREIHGLRVYISHGDGKAFNDRGYEILKRLLRARLSNTLFRILHPDIGIGAASYASRHSRDHTSKKNYSNKKDSNGDIPGESDGLFVFAQRKIAQDGFDLVVMGHSHRPVRIDMPHGGIYINLGAWLGADRHYLAVDSVGVDLRRWGGIVGADVPLGR